MFFFSYCIMCNIFLSFTTNPSFSLLQHTVKQHLVCFICLFLSIPPSFWLSLVAGLFLLSPAMMAPHLAVGTMRNDKMGEPCFYLMGQNQTTVCSQKSVPIHLPSHLFLTILSTLPSSSSLPASHFVCVYVLACLHSVCALWFIMPDLKISLTSVNPYMHKPPASTSVRPEFCFLGLIYCHCLSHIAAMATCL